jgi:hypothetical protein
MIFDILNEFSDGQFSVFSQRTGQNQAQPRFEALEESPEVRRSTQVVDFPMTGEKVGGKFRDVSPVSI